MHLEATDINFKRTKLYCLSTGICYPISFFRVKFVDITTNQRTNGPVNTHLISWPSKAQNIQNLDNIW